MKIKFLALAMIAMLFTACKPDPQTEGGEGSGTNKGEVESSYIAISLASTGMDRADEKFDDGLDTERTVNSIHVFFFKNGEPFFGASSNNQYNYQSIDIKIKEETKTNNISDINESVLVIKNYKGELPNQMVAVLNWNPKTQPYTLKGLQEELVGYKNENITFIMSNSTYRNAAGNVYAAPLEITDFKNKQDDAIKNPVKVYVERVAAKVKVKTTGDIDDDQPSTADAHIFKLQQKKNDNTNTNFITLGGRTIYAKILGWDIYNDYTQSYLLKELPTDLAHNDEWNGFWWNSPSNHRSYWAVNAPQAAGYRDQFNWNTMTYPEQMYCCENTSGNAESAAAARTKVVLKAQLQDENGNKVEVARWFGSDYDGKQNLLIAVKNTLVNTYYYGVGEEKDKDGNHTKFQSIEWQDLMTVAGNGTTAAVYQVYFQLSKETGFGESRTWYVRSGDTFTKTNATAINGLLDDIDPALLYSDGQTYYQTDIQHLGTTFGVVRNHVYDIDIKSITGYGTPVVDLNYVINTPEIPLEDEQTFVAAEINILSWRVVENNVNL
jgi:hypothetical protein